MFVKRMVVSEVYLVGFKMMVLFIVSVGVIFQVSISRGKF